MISNSGQDYNPTWSPNGKKIAFACEKDDPNICVANADGTDHQTITGDAGKEYDPDWSPTGEKIVYSSNRTGAFQAHITGSTGDNWGNVTSGSGSCNPS